MRFVNGSVTLAGDLAVPVGPVDRWPAVVMVGGSGPSDRNNDTLFPPIRAHLVRAGIAVLSYDKRGVGSSSGDWRAATIDDLAADAAAALGWLREQPAVRSDAVGFFGHSEGGWVVLRAAQRGDASFVIVNGCPGIPPAAQDRFAIETALRIDGVPDEGRAAVLARYDALVDAGRRDADFDEVAGLFAGGSPTLTDLLGEVDTAMWTFLKRKQDHDPVPDLRRLRVPLLALFGSADRMVPVERSAAAFAAAVGDVERASAATTTIKVFPAANHRGRTGDGEEFVPGFLSTISDWINSQR